MEHTLLSLGLDEHEVEEIRQLMDDFGGDDELAVDVVELAQRGASQNYIVRYIENQLDIA